MSGPDRTVYFAYGSNLLFARLYARIPSIKKLSTAQLPGHRLSFNKPGGDGSGKCGIEKAGSEDFVLGVLYEMDIQEKPALDRIEGLGHGYFDAAVEVVHENTAVNAFTYYPSRLDCEVRPFDWYKAFVLSGALENYFPGEYITFIESVESQIDSNEQRRKNNFDIIATALEDPVCIQKLQNLFI